MPFHFSPVHFLQYLLKREATQFFISIAIRNLALGMVLLFEPIYLYLYFGKSLSLAFLFFASIHILFGILAFFGGKIMAKIGLKHTMLFSHFFFFGYYLSLFFLPSSFLFLPLAIILKGVGMTFFWPAFHIDFCRFSEKDYLGREVGKLNIAVLIPTVISPIIGGWILTAYNYPVLFSIVLIVLFASAIPMFLSRELHLVYSDSYQTAWARIFKKVNRKINIAIIANGLEVGTNAYCWPLFMAILAINYETMGGIVTFALIMAAVFALYLGKLSDRLINRIRLLNIGVILTSISWMIKYFVTTSFTAFLAHTLYRICRTTATIPYHTFLYEKASLKGGELDEFIIYREILLNCSRGFFYIILAGFFFFLPKINLVFLFIAFISFGLMFIGIPPKIKKS